MPIKCPACAEENPDGAIICELCQAVLRPLGPRIEAPRTPQGHPLRTKMQIQSVTLDGAPFSGFSCLTRELTLAANQGGKLAVTFGRDP